MLSRTSIIAIALSSLLMLPGCGGGGADSTVNNTTVSKGQALIDLKKAYDAGAISEREYEKQRQKILDED
ncbi:SHOCT domain-containing protein [Dongia sp. agr-C8]